jgi:hypothetical protein
MDRPMDTRWSAFALVKALALFGWTRFAPCVAYSSLEGAGRMAVFRETLPPAAGAWLPNTVFVAAIILLGFRSAVDESRTTNVERRT